MTVILSANPTASASALRLRPWRAEDATALVTAHRDPLLRRWLTTSLVSEAEARRWIDEQNQGWADGVRFSFAILECGSDKNEVGDPVGHVVVKASVDPTSASAEVGYWTSATVRGRGIAPRALDVVSRWVLGSQRLMPLARLDLLHAVDNHASCRVAEKCRYALRSVLPAQPPAFPTEGHLHVRTRRNRLLRPESKQGQARYPSIHQ
ncbi:GNAT family N-acetyltransferase [Nonomuraea turkmeniaca]|uniref:GNAT family N-acetyltransferase n=1 Tax=Nonomuraea turkmeniaca TaxID=103838 RepID=A0A5S4FY48_9ACTN|nr:GNAT family N-acetyltransferase [Nonomuraea turkmeniaca]TMR25636.1 GNAT family N-acetyltransferase [Nonomuraea turkmeniaca]